ncbi:hypothetical protein GCHA_1136 [Paraglaciecola chathamensis S18K6]|uniref:Uncharacterized protein n=2 Tax=Paraglaciecola chathamensis TaxID=368405 RepID=A0ABQ0I6P9_9ALTE|nr:hypothetical protein GAGA_2180 [Paraglaciecola agarilytica NO2]GAC09098.1 hypothetical protein GCHA_1136 [Paraglaciecola chathamensis S18K6]
MTGTKKGAKCALFVTYLRLLLGAKCAETFVELVNTTASINVTLLTSVERMAR